MQNIDLDFAFFLFFFKRMMGLSSPVLPHEQPAYLFSSLTWTHAGVGLWGLAGSFDRVWGRELKIRWAVEPHECHILSHRWGLMSICNFIALQIQASKSHDLSLSTEVTK